MAAAVPLVAGELHIFYALVQCCFGNPFILWEARENPNIFVR